MIKADKNYKMNFVYFVKSIHENILCLIVFILTFLLNNVRANLGDN